MKAHCSIAASARAATLDAPGFWSVPAPAQKPLLNARAPQRAISSRAFSQPISKRCAVSIASATPKPSASSRRRSASVVSQSRCAPISDGAPGRSGAWPSAR
jgi:hypothetical protein